MVAAGTVGAVGFMVADFLGMPASLRRVASRVRVGMVAGIGLGMAARVERLRRGMGCRDGRSVAGWECREYRMGGRRFITVGGMIGDEGMGMAWGMGGMGRWIMAGSMPTIRSMGMRIIQGMDTTARTMLVRMMMARA
jgi:hypothetical protein